MVRRSRKVPEHEEEGTPQTGRLPNFLIIGAPKAGTSALAAYLEAHPDVYIPPEKEIHFFNLHYTIDRADNYSRGLDWYRSKFEDAGAARAVGEATPSYMLDEDAPGRIARAIPDAKLIAILRNPVDRAYSHYWYQRSVYPSPASFGDIVRAEMRGEPSPAWRHPHPYLLWGRYLPQLQRVCVHYPRESLLVLLYEDLRSSPEETFAIMCRFLDVDERVVPANVGEVVNPTRPVRSGRLRTAMLRWHAWKRLPPQLATAIDNLNRIKGPYPPMEPELRAELLEWFAADNAALASWLGRDLSVWGA